MQLLKDINYKKMITNRIMVTGIMILLEFALLIALFWRAIQYSGWIFGAFYLLSILYVFYLVCKDDAASYRIGGILVIVLIPPLGAFLYMLWGDKKPSKKLRARLQLSYLAMDKYLQDNQETCQALEEISERTAATARYIKKTSRYPLYRNTHVTYYPVGEKMFEAMLEEMRKAKHFIFLEFFIVEEGEMWGRMLEVLLEKAREGVKIKVIYDDIGCMSTLPGDYVKTLQSFGIDATLFSKLKGNVDGEFNNRSHRKILVVDGKVGYTGGVNVADEYINQKQRFGHWKDVGIRSDLSVTTPSLSKVSVETPKVKKA